MTSLRLLPVAVLLSALAACSEQAPQENVFKAQTDALDKAEAANQMLEDAAAAQRKAIEEQGR